MKFIRKLDPAFAFAKIFLAKSDLNLSLKKNQNPVFKQDLFMLFSVCTHSKQGFPQMGKGTFRY